MPANPRPTEGDAITIDNLLIGMPYVEFTPTIAGVPQQPINLGVVDSAELAKELETLALESSQSGTRRTLRELVTKIDPQFDLGLFNFSAEVLRFTLGSASITQVVANAAAPILAEDVVLTTDPADYLGLVNALLNDGSVRVDPSAVDNEQVGTSDGALGAASGEFSLDYKVRDFSDVSEVRVVTAAGVVTLYTPVDVGAASAGNEVEVVSGLGATSGDLQFFVGGVATDVPSGSRVEVDYEPTFGLVQMYPLLADIAAAISDDGGVFTDETADANEATVDDVVLIPASPAVNDAFYVGQVNQFDAIEVDVTTAEVGGTIAWEYWDGSTWTPVDLIADGTTGFTVAGRNVVSFQPQDDWVATTVNSQGPFFYVRARVATTGASGALASEVDVSSSDDYRVDLKNGRVQISADADKSSGSSPVIAGQEVDVTYTYNQLAANQLAPFSQNVFSGSARIRQLTDVGINMIWNIPSVQVQVTDDALTFADDDFTVGTMTIKLLDAGGAAPFGTLDVYSEAQANA